MRISEIFGPTIQGEGPFAGRRAMFVRTSGCNLQCTYCDTPYTWDWTRFNRDDEQTAMTPKHVVQAVREMGANDTDLLVVTGGEPMAQQSGVREIVALWAGDVQIETNGTLAPKTGGVTYVVSPHLSNGGGKAGPIRIDVLKQYASLGAHFKFVATLKTINEAAALVEQVGVARNKVWLMPEGTTNESVAEGLSQLAPEAIKHGWNITTRLQVQLWGDKRGK